MAIKAKICGLNTPGTIEVAVSNGASYVGFNFYPPSPRSLTPEVAGALARLVPEGICRVGIFVDPDNNDIEVVLDQVPLNLLQLHGAETRDRTAEIKQRFERPVMKAIRVAARADIDKAHDYEAVADMLLFDAKAPADLADALPGGNGLIFDWNLLKDRNWQRPWMLSGGLDAVNVADAVAISGAETVDVSSGVESAPGHKDPDAIKAFLDAVGRL